MYVEVEEYIAQRKAAGLADGSIKQHRQSLKRLLNYLERIRVNRWQNVRPDHMDAFLCDMKRRGLGISSREWTVNSSRCFLRWLMDRGKIISDPARHIDTPRPDYDDLPLLEPPLSEEEVAEFLSSMPRDNAVDIRNIAHIELLYSAGLRISESMGLDLRDIDFANRVVHVRNGKGSKKRDVPMMRGLFGALRDYLCLRRSLLKGPDHGALLLTERGQRMNMGAWGSMSRRINKRRPGKPHIHAHLFRHSIAVHLLRGGADVRYVQAFLGHESLESTRIYLKLVPADLRKEYDKAMPDIAVDTKQPTDEGSSPNAPVI